MCSVENCKCAVDPKNNNSDTLDVSKHILGVFLFKNIILINNNKKKELWPTVNFYLRLSVSIVKNIALCASAACFYYNFLSNRETYIFKNERFNILNSRELVIQLMRQREVHTARSPDISFCNKWTLKAKPSARTFVRIFHS